MLYGRRAVFFSFRRISFGQSVIYISCCMGDGAVFFFMSGFMMEGRLPFWQQQKWKRKFGTSTFSNWRLAQNPLCSKLFFFLLHIAWTPVFSSARLGSFCVFAGMVWVAFLDVLWCVWAGLVGGAARAKWVERWTMPSSDEHGELCKYIVQKSWMWYIQHGVRNSLLRSVRAQTRGILELLVLARWCCSPRAAPHQPPICSKPGVP